jgi:lysophospholipase L1-like esterase
MPNRHSNRIRVTIASAFLAITALAGGAASASTIAQNASWTITRPAAAETFRVVAYGDSIYAGYISIFSAAKRAAPHVAGEYGAALWGQNVNVVRRAQSGAVASGVYARINATADRAFMQTANTRMVTFEMCGNDYLQARSNFKGQSGTCNYAGLEAAGANCRTYTQLAMQNINQHAHPNAKLKIVANLYYPGYNADNVQSGCTDPESGQRINLRDKFFPLLVESNWWTCTYAEQHGFECADSFAEYMGADYDSNGDGVVDSEALRWRSGEALEDYVQRVTVDLRSTVRDSNFKLASASTSYDYLLSDDTHPTHSGQTGTSGTTAVQYATPGPYADGKNPVWNVYGHDRMGWSLTAPYALTVDAGADATILACETFASSGNFDDRVFMGWSGTVDYGDGSGPGELAIDGTSFALEHQYRTAGTHTVSVTVTNSYNSGGDTAQVTVLTASEAITRIIADIRAIQAAGGLKAGQANGLVRPLESALGKLPGSWLQAQSMILDFIAEVNRKVADGALTAEDAARLIEAAQRAHAAAACMG